jgi:ECF transporter S component (folate family)
MPPNCKHYWTEIIIYFWTRDGNFIAFVPGVWYAFPDRVGAVRKVPGGREVALRTNGAGKSFPPAASDADPASAGGKLNMKTKRLVTNGLCVAVNVVLSTVAGLHLGPMTISLSGLPILLGAVMFGPVDGAVIGLLGGLISQLLGPYGVSATTPLWILPPALLGLVMGLYARKRNYELTERQLGLWVFVALCADTTLTTGVMWVDCLVYHYSFVTYSPYIVWRYVADVIKAGIYVLVLPPLVKALRSVKS